MSNAHTEQAKSVPLQCGNRVCSTSAARTGIVVRVYADGSASVCWDDGKPQAEGLGHERMPRQLLQLLEQVAAPAREMRIYAIPGCWAVYEGTRAQLQAEKGLIPAGLKWPDDITERCQWTSGGLFFWINQRRPEGFKGPRKLWMREDWWALCIRPATQQTEDWCRIQQKAKELRRLMHLETEAGRAEQHTFKCRYIEACTDSRFQAFKALIPALVPPKRERKGAVNHE